MHLKLCGQCMDALISSIDFLSSSFTASSLKPHMRLMNQIKAGAARIRGDPVFPHDATSQYNEDDDRNKIKK